MDQSSKNNRYNASDIQRYHAGQMSAEEMHALEKAAQDDPFLADALEGYLNTATPLEDLKKIRSRLEEKTERKKIHPLFFRHTPWMRAAAIFLFIAGAGWLLYTNLSTKDEISTSPTAQSEKKADSTVVTDMLAKGKIPSDSNTGNAYLQNDQKVKNQKGTLIAPGVVTLTNKSNDEKKSAGREFLNAEKASEFSFKTAEGKIIKDSSVPPLTPVNKTMASTANADKALQSRKETKDARQTVNDSDAYRDMALSGKAEGVFQKDTISNFNVVLKPVDQTVSEVVVSAPNRKYKQGARPIVIIDTLEPAEGWVKYDDYVANNLKIPEELKRKDASGEVQLTFDVNKYGEATNIRVEKSLCDQCDEEAIRLLKEGPKWKKKKNKKGKLTVRF